MKYCKHPVTGLPQNHAATGWLISPTGSRITAQCAECAQTIIDEFREKLGERWTFAPNEDPAGAA